MRVHELAVAPDLQTSRFIVMAVIMLFEVLFIVVTMPAMPEAQACGERVRLRDLVDTCESASKSGPPVILSISD
jgi:hypothetical protein